MANTKGKIGVVVQKLIENTHVVKKEGRRGDFCGEILKVVRSSGALAKASGEK